MTLMQEQATDLIMKMPDEKIYYLVNLLNGFVETTPTDNEELTNSQKAYENLQRFRRRGTVDMDYKAELYCNPEYKNFEASEVPDILPEKFLSVVQC